MHALPSSHPTPLPRPGAGPAWRRARTRSGAWLLLILAGIGLAPGGAEPLAAALDGGSAPGTLFPEGPPAQELPADTLPPLPADTWADAGTRDLLTRAQARRGQLVEGLDSYDARMRERFYVGLDGRGFRRERGVLSEERHALIRWEASGDRRVAWEAARRDVDLAGFSTARDSSAAAGLASELGTGRLPPPLLYAPGSDRIAFGGGGQFALDPLSDTAGFHYRFHPGDTLRITLPEVAEPLTLVEVRVEPRRSEFRLVAASLWFDRATAALVRAVYRPSRPFDLALDGGPDAPRFLGSIGAEIRVVSVDHGLYDLQWWIPRRFLFEGEVNLGRWARIPLQVDWELSDVEVNAPLAGILAQDEPPEGWTRVENPNVLRQSTGDSVTVIRFVPPAERLAERVPERMRGAAGEQPFFTAGELRELEARLGSLLPAPGLGRLEWGWGLGSGLARFNRVEGAAFGVSVRTLLPGSREVEAGLRMGTEALAPTGELRFSRGDFRKGWDAQLYRRLEGSSEWHDPGSLGASLGNAVNGEGPTPWYRSWGASFGLERAWSRTRGRAELFAERQGSAEIGTDWHLRGVWGRAYVAPPIPEAVEGDWVGTRGVVRWQSGVDATRVRLFGAARVEGAAGTSTYARSSVQGGVVVPLGAGWAAAVETGGGAALGSLPAQRRFYPGGALVYRPVEVGEVVTEAFGLARAEVGRGFTGARLVAFVDMLAPREEEGVRWGTGVGASFLDGLLRADLAREMEPRGRWRVHFYLDALF